MKVDPATLKVGDEVRWVMEITGGRVIREVVVSEVCPRFIRLGLAYIAPGNGTWYIRKPTEGKPVGKRQRRRYLPTIADDKVRERFFAKVDKSHGDDGCWLWTGSKNAKGYGQFKFDGLPHLAHRVAYMMEHGEIEDEVLDHLCRNRACVNPAHLEPVSVRENTLRGETVATENANKTNCPKGHPLDVGNLRPSSVKRGQRECQTCHRESARDQQRLVKEARKLLGIGHVEYVAQYGQSRNAALEVIQSIAKPKKPKDTARLQDSAVTERLQRPDEPPVGSFFRVDRTGVEYVRVEKYGLRQYFLVAGLGHWAWDEITIPGDTITLLELTEKGDKKDGGV
jgi:hypothetical protein